MTAVYCLGALLALGSVTVLAFNNQQQEDWSYGGQQQESEPLHRQEDLNPGVLGEYAQGDILFKRREAVPPGEAEEEVPPEIQADPHYVQTGSFGKSWAGLKSLKHFTLGSCSTRLTTPSNSVLKCSTYSGCQATCMRGYTFPSGDTQIFFVCEEGKWKVRDSENDTIPQCKPNCIPPCQHGGSCVSPNTCDCPDTFSGPYCQYERKRCVGFPPTPNNARKICNSESCTITCLDKHQFPDGSGIANVFCKEGEWSPARPDWPTIPDCKPVCIPECQNGGSCLAFNMCNCPQQFRGQFCQYSVDACDARKLNFNGNYNCTENGEAYSCSLSCPGGMDFQTPPPSSFSCLFSEGRFNPSTVPQCIFIGEGETSNMKFMFGGEGRSMHSETGISSKAHKYKSPDLSEGYSDLIKGLYVLEKKTPTPGTCFAWAGYHYRTFDGRVISFKSGCTYTLASDVVDNTFQIQSVAHNCSDSSCHLGLSFYIGDKRYQLLVNDNGMPVIETGSRQWPVPSQLSDLRTEVVGYAVVASLQGLGVSLRWNLQDESVEVRATEALWNRTGGLCGRMDGHATNDLQAVEDSVVAYANKWQATPPTEQCSNSVEEDACLDSASQQVAHQFCNRLMVDQRFAACRKILPARQYYDACRWDHCICGTCACRSIAMFVRDCLQKGEKSVENWRDQDMCPVECKGGRVYKACGPPAVATCMTEETEVSSTECEEGCYCPTGMRLHEGRCIPREQCPCYLRGKPFPHGHKVPKDCNTCECVGGQWTCTEIQCEARCTAIGDPHYQTFDGRRYNFMGKCSYYLLQTENYTIDAENVACDGHISEGLGFFLGTGGSTPSCTKAVTIHMGDSVIKLKQGREVTVNNEDVETLPATLAGAYLRLASSLFLQVELPDGVEVWWDGQTRVYITAPPAMKGKTKGLCGTFNGNQQDDFLTPEGDVEQDPSAFANKWKTKEVCDNTKSDTSSHPCDQHVQNRAMAEKQCATITSNLFTDCHFLVDPAPYYEDCLYDVCSCQGPLSQCLCPVVASYAKACSFQGAVIDWRAQVKGCGVLCPSGQKYQPCGSSCARSCSDLARPCPHHWPCIEGCYCPTGHTIGPHGDCVPVTSCPCIHNGMEYPPSHREIRPSAKGPQFCTCQNAVWQCSPATPQQIQEYPEKSMSVKMSCSATRHQEFTHCEPPEPVTCKNMHNPPAFSAAICRSGCVCRRGFVLDSLSGNCVRPSECPCHHGGQSYPDGQKIQEECNTCTCEAGKWSCTQHSCPGVCSAWGDSHFRTFDSRIFDFQGACEYVMAKGSLSDSDIFYVALEMVPCGSSGVSCSKSVTLYVGSGDSKESVTFSVNKPLPATTTLNRMTVRQAGLFVFAEVADLGVVLQWDRGTRVLLRVDPKWKGRLRGLCGNYNNDDQDDFQTPSGGVTEVSAQLFGDSWRLQEYCPEPPAVTDTCKLHPNRKSWAAKKCGILKSPVFRPCHSEVPIEPYLERCIFDTCGCDQGGDCECLCTAIAAYAQECNAHGVHIRWRSQQLCPVQCDETCSEYKPCVETCPTVTCDNLLGYKSYSGLCQQDTCVEGCEIKPCPEGEVYKSLDDMTCTPIATCPNTVCMEVNGTKYYEGDLMEEDDCHSCHCSHHKKSCSGQPCTPTPSPTPPTVTGFSYPPTDTDLEMQCIDGWSHWVNSNHPKPGVHVEQEPLPAFDQLVLLNEEFLNETAGQCNRDMMVKIECLTVDGQHFKETGQDVVCTREGGLKCVGNCEDYKIRVYCECAKPTPTPTPSTEWTTPTLSSTETPKPTGEWCDVLHPLKPHPTDCSRYFQCTETSNGLEVVERECAPSLWYHPETMNCDWPDTVVLVRPECKGKEITPAPTSSTQWTPFTEATKATPETEKPVCTESWSEWANITHPTSDDGDFEFFGHITAAGIYLCPGINKFIKDIECQYHALVPPKTGKSGGKGNKGGKGKKGNKQQPSWEFKDYRESKDVGVACSPLTGLSCFNEKQLDGQCEDYRIRVLCGCEPLSLPTERPTTQSTSEAPKPTPSELLPTLPTRKPETTLSSTEIPTATPTPSGCKSDEHWVDCDVRCDQLCLHYEQVVVIQGKCSSGQKCIPGCYPIGSSPNCSAGYRWREWGSCVKISDCTCRSETGAIVKPGEVVYETVCKVCTCENNHYTCDTSRCNTPTPATAGTPSETPPTKPTTEHVTPPLPTEAETTITNVPVTGTPPANCEVKDRVPLVVHLPESAFSATSFIEGHEPWQAKMTSSAWKPQEAKHNEFLRIDLGRLEAIYAVVIEGGLEHVTGFTVAYSSDNITYSYILENPTSGLHHIFRGGLYGKKLETEFPQAIEARYVIIKPMSWDGYIALKVELMGCSEMTTVTTEVTTPTPTVTASVATPTPTVPASVATLTPTTIDCIDEMGLDNGNMNPLQVTVSSAKSNQFQGNDAALSAAVGWIPLLHSPSEWIQFDLLGERIITGLKTRGSTQAIENMYEPAWVTSFTVTYSQDLSNWSPLLTADQKDEVFLGNYDSSSVQTTKFVKPIHARYVRVYPKTWHNIPALKVELVGCFEPYPPVTPPSTAGTTELPTTVTEGSCNVCKGAPPPEICSCIPSFWWSGVQCVYRTDCPCYVGHIKYDVGVTFDTEDCERCTCILNGLTRCEKITCPPCGAGERSEMTSKCGCICKPCPEGTRLCATSNVCIDNNRWCDGIIDCPDDEVFCPTAPPTQPTTVATVPTTLVPPTPNVPKCVEPTCPPGTYVRIIKKAPQEPQRQEQATEEFSPFGTNSKWSSWFKDRGGVKGGVKGTKGAKGTKGRPPHHKTRPRPPTKTPPPRLICPEYTCEPEEPSPSCPPSIDCPDGYVLKTEQKEWSVCPEHTCVPIPPTPPPPTPPPPPGKCNITGRTFDTFDGMEYKYDICDHVLAQDMISKEWQIKLKRNCPYVGQCSKALVIVQQSHSIQINEDLGIVYNGYSYTVPQMQKIGSQTEEFVIRQVSDKFIIFASILGFTVVWDIQGNVKITVQGSWLGEVDGLCGFYDGNHENDRRKPDGTQARTSGEFGDSWGPADCETRVCPKHIQDMAWEMCGVIKEEPLNQCAGPINLNKAMSLCTESVCQCMDRNVSDKDACRCQALLDMVTTCQVAKPSVDLYKWRTAHDCPVECPPPLVHRECFKRVCESSCEDVLQEDACPAVPDACFPGCYCPDGLVRQGSQCVKPIECRDCVCNGFGTTRFVTFDRVDFTYNANCTHVLAQTLEKSSGPKFKVLETNGPCRDHPEHTCIWSITILYKAHTVHFGRPNAPQTVLVDDASVVAPQDLGWATIRRTANSEFTFSIPEIHLDLLFNEEDSTFSLRLPSHLYKGATEGLCGSCNNDQADDFKMRNGEVTDNTDEFGKSWRETDLPPVLGTEEECSVVPGRNCTPPVEDDFCLKLMDEAIFGKCHAVVDPKPFVELCHESWCQRNNSGCQDLEPYAKECQAAGICLHWRSENLCPYQCPEGLEYQACGLGCQVTCDNVALYRKNPAACTNPPTESCICPGNKVWKNNTCVEENRCQPCDAEGHYPGETWKPDLCTSCSCEIGRAVKCERTQCTTVLCEVGYKAVTKSGTESDCCPEIICVLKEINCTTPRKPITCAKDQEMKVEKGPNGCNEYVCECLPPEKCPDISTAIVFREPGMHTVIKETGCCPEVVEECRPETCPPPPRCPQFMEPRPRDTERCCLDYRCEPLNETCLYEMEFTNNPKGGEQKRKPSEKVVVAKKVGEVWQDGPCRTCECMSHGWRAKCTKQSCPAPPNDVGFLVKAFPQPKQCCPEYKRTACLVGGVVYKEGDLFASPDGDPCKNVTCARSPNSGELVFHETVQTCNKDCPLGWDYSDAVFSNQCCGECRPVACLVEGDLHAPSTSWSSPDNCTTFSCDIDNKEVKVTISKPDCPKVDDCLPDRLINDGCCNKCLPPTDVYQLCNKDPLSINKTVGLIQEVQTSHGLCKNYEPIPNFYECRGVCESRSFYNQLSEHYDSDCQCCQPLKFRDINVTLKCEDNSSIDKVIAVPTSCICSICSASHPLGPEAARPFRYTKA